MDFLDIVMELRKRYGVQVPEEDYKELGSPRRAAPTTWPSALMESKELKLGA